MCRGIPDRPTADSDFGTRVHEFLAGKIDAIELTHEMLDIAESCQSIEAKVVKQWRARCEVFEECEIPDGGIRVSRDCERLWLEIHGEKRCSGVADVIHSWGRHALVVDFKTLTGDHKDSTDNLQLRCLAILANRNFDYRLKSVDVAIVQPLVTHTPTVTHYDGPALHAAMEELVGILNASEKPDAPLVAGDQCRFCRAAAICPAVRKEVETLAVTTINATGLTVSDSELATLLGRCGAARKMIESVKAECFRRAEADPETWRAMGYEIREGAGKRAVEDIATVSDRLNAMGVPWQKITGACSITLKALEPLVREATKEKGMGLKKKVGALLEDCVAIKKSKPSLKKIGVEDDEE